MSPSIISPGGLTYLNADSKSLFKNQVNLTASLNSQFTSEVNNKFTLQNTKINTPKVGNEEDLDDILEIFDGDSECSTIFNR